MDCRHAVQVLSVINHEFLRLIDLGSEGESHLA